MESLARPPHRRKHSAITSTLSFKNPYDEVLKSSGGGGGRRKSFEANEYAEIFSGPSSIPVIDLSGLDERAGFGSGESRSSKLDYSSIFGGLRNDDVAVPYEELFGGTGKKTKPRIPAEAPSRQQESVSQHSSDNKRSSSNEVPDQFADGVKQHFNMSFNRTTQRNMDEPNGKTHIAELHAVPGFTFFVDGNSRMQKREVGPAPPLKRGVSRTWSFSAEFEATKGKVGSSHDESHIPEKLHKVDEVNLKSNFSNFSPSSRCSSNLTDKDNEQLRVNSFATKQDDASGKISGECSPTSLDEEFDENSVAAVSAAALKKAIDQAQESIRIAKMIMERKKESLLDGPRGRVKILEKEKKCDELGAIFTLFTGIDGKLAPSLGRNDPVIKTGNSDVKMVEKNVESTKEHVLFTSDCSWREKICMDEEVEKQKVRENVEEAEMCKKTTDFPGLEANTECRTASLESVSKESENDADDNRKHEETFEAHEEMYDVERNSLNESSNLVGSDMMEQEKMKKEAEHISEWKENVHTHGENCDEEPFSFPEMREFEKKVDEVYEPETDENEQNHADDGNVPLLSEELEKNQVEERLIINSELEATETIIMKTNNDAQVPKDAAFWDAEVANNCFLDSNNSEGPTTPSILIEDTQEDRPRDADVNHKTEEFNHDDSSIPELDGNEMPGMDSLRRSASEGTFLESSKLQNAFENISFIEQKENIDMMDANSLPEDDVNAFRASSEIIDADNTIPEFDLSDVVRMLEQTSESDEASVSAQDSEECPENAMEETKNKLEMVPNEGKCAEEQDIPKEMEKSLENGKKTEERENHQQRIEAIKKGREREKDRKAVERAIREARERAFAEARERAERAAVDRAAAEVRQRAMAEARDKATKGKQTADKASIEAKLRAERAAVERATAEARERALEKARSQKTDRYGNAERSSSSSRNNGLKHSFSSSDLESGTTNESPQRRKARLERHQRIMERAAKALEEKNMRDCLAQKEQAERNRLAESLDADIKRWASGKEGNLRALLSTLQYILGAESGWQPISLTEIITTPAVKKAYRKATLYVHPDKLQQRGATIQQKYICEKVFDLLKAAWNRFNSEER